MLAKFLTLFILISSMVLARSSILSPIPAAPNEVLTVDPETCDNECQKKLLDEGKVFTFISKHNKESNSTYLRGKYQVYQSIFKLVENEENGESLRIAVLVPSSVIGRYASMVTDGISAFLIDKGVNFTIKVYDSETEELDALKEQAEAINKDGYKYIVAPLTQKGAETLASLGMHDNIIYIPTVNKKDVAISKENIIYGGIDYKNQLRELSAYEKGTKIVIFEEPVDLSRKLTTYADESIMLPPKVVEIKTKRTKFQDVFLEEELDLNTTILLNTRPVMTSLILSQLTYFDVNVSAVLTTQINYNPMILSLTQEKDLEKLFVANSITKEFDKLYEINRLTDNDLLFNWIVYSTSIGVDLIKQDYFGKEIDHSKTFDVGVIDGNVEYPVNIYKVDKKRFTKAPEPILEIMEEEGTLENLEKSLNEAEGY